MEVDRLVEICKEHGYGYRLNGENPQLVLVGEAHGNDCLDAQEQIIEAVSPRLILHEGADPELDYREETERIFEWREKYGIPVELCDIPNKNSTNPRASKEALERSVGRVLDDFGFSGDYKACLDMTNSLREMYMARTIGNQVDQGNLPLVAVVGAGHAMPRSKIHYNLKSNGVGYVTIIQQSEVLQVLREDATFFKTS